MQVQNPKPEDKTEMTTTEPKEITEDKALELARKLHDKEITYEDINDEDIEKEIHERFIIGREEIPEPGDDTETREEGVTETEEKSVTETEKVPEKTQEDQDFLRERKERLDELNRIQQKADAAAKRLEEVEILPPIPEKKKFDDVLSEEAIQSVIERQDKIESRQAETLNNEKEKLTTELRDIKTEKMFLELSGFQSDNISLKTSKPVKVLNAQYKKFVGEVGGLENVDKFLTDNAYKEQMEGKGISFPMSDDDYKKFDQISKINTFKMERKYPSISSAFHDYQKENGIVLDEVKNAAIKAAQDTLEKIGGDGGATTLSPDDGSVESTKSEMDTKQMETWLVNHPNPTTPDELRMAEAIHDQIRAQRG